MTLFELVKIKKELLAFSTQDIRDGLASADKDLTRFYDTFFPFDFAGRRDMVSSMINAAQEIDNIDKNVRRLLASIEEKIDGITQNYLARGYIVVDCYGSNSTDIPGERGRTLFINDEVRSYVIGKIRAHTLWQYPSLEIGPGDGVWTAHMIAADPLYLVDVHQEFLDSSIKQFPIEFQRRVCGYLTGQAAKKSDTDLSELPRNQFGFVFSWNLFDYFPLAHIDAYLKECYEILRPGGVMMFSYNNCDDLYFLRMVEQGMKSWMTPKLLKETCEKNGFEIVCMEEREKVASWIEIKKPGVLETVKRHQVMGELRSIGT
jgi:SAM-dependent methyltransferase